MSFQIKGADLLIKNLGAMGPKMLQEGGRALYQVGLPKLAEMKRRTPVDTGAARASLDLEKPVIEHDSAWVRFVAGGAAQDYIVPLHERLDVFHKVGQAKFMESVILESRPTLLADVRARIDLNRVVR